MPNGDGKDDIERMGRRLRNQGRASAGWRTFDFVDYGAPFCLYKSVAGCSDHTYSELVDANKAKLLEAYVGSFEGSGDASVEREWAKTKQTFQTMIFQNAVDSEVKNKRHLDRSHRRYQEVKEKLISSLSSTADGEMKMIKAYLSGTDFGEYDGDWVHVMGLSMVLQVRIFVFSWAMTRSQGYYVDPKVPLRQIRCDPNDLTLHDRVDPTKDIVVGHSIDRGQHYLRGEFSARARRAKLKKRSRKRSKVILINDEEDVVDLTT